MGNTVSSAELIEKLSAAEKNIVKLGEQLVSNHM